MANIARCIAFHVRVKERIVSHEMRPNPRRRFARDQSDCVSILFVRDVINAVVGTNAIFNDHLLVFFFLLQAALQAALPVERQA